MNAAGSATNRPPVSPRQPDAEPQPHSKPPSTPPQRRWDARENAPDVLGALFFAVGGVFIPDEEPLQQSPPSPDWQPLQQELCRRAADSAGETCAFTFLLPESGEVDVTLATRQPTGWEVSLRFSPAAYRRWQRQASLCQRLLRQALDGPVHLSIEQEVAV
ncbi:type III secretion system HrpP C-terminal domain-containing protein [Klebsiella indica]|uniref:Type III secretion system protein n=1 Tax=Klebsiella indica TaxID=2582917 RepID=A0A5R9LDL5_9ENTR|nr:type III secretion system HrpP C-terminal domain-containing protein [Klebsiella indica]TLV11648.1 type III secretion system protein [Klebsiella indica]